MKIIGIDKVNKITYIAALFLLIYEDSISFMKIFKYLKEMFEFNPPVVHIDYSLEIRKALKTENIFKKPPVIRIVFSLCSIDGYKNEENRINKKIHKYAFEIIKNIKLVCFI